MLKQIRSKSVLLGHERRDQQKRKRPTTRKIKFSGVITLASASDRQLLINSVEQMKAHASDPFVKKIILDFSAIKSLNSCGTLFLAAQIERILNSAEFSVVVEATYPNNTTVEQMFQHMGLLEKLGLSSRVKKLDSSDVTPWLYVSGYEGDLESVAEKLPRILVESTNLTLRMALLSGMAEAVANSSEHAYDEDAGGAETGRERQKWWLFARQVDEYILVVICDLGLGIPGTLEANWKEELAAILKTRTGMKRKDHKMIELAFTVGKSSTNEKHRGKGLKDILKVVKEQHVGAISIYSNKGSYSIDNIAGTRYSGDDKSSIGGTIIQWKVPIEEFGFMSEAKL
ncbi:hypothetical protein B7453_07580 [Pseudomonas sp. IB20]|uniref:hypothetical protein n=1 Tax=Pseudomonas TaxID=286 RepID=UPI000BA0DBBB|nr:MULTISPECIES: hypothetical protein [unclassified Pseudomonas]MCV2226283.1 hypothetical protein [Pseudomonas sp. AU10]OZO05168.1 hypothetical protein B7453_07580 [Pseudomonas sp. IB20]